MSGVEAAKLIALGAAKLAAQEAARLIASLEDVCAQPFGQEMRAWICRRALVASYSDARRRPN